MDDTLQAVAKAYVPLITTHEKKYGYSKIYDDLMKVIKDNLERLNRFCEVLV
jgi:hypothetical protein